MKKYNLNCFLLFSFILLAIFILIRDSASAKSLELQIQSQKKISGENNLLRSKYIVLRDKIADSFIKRYSDSIIYEEEAKSRKWNYEQGLILEAFRQIWLETNDKKYFNYIQKQIDNYVQEDGSIQTYKLEDYNIDNIAPGRSLIFLYQLTRMEKYKKAADVLRKQLQNHPRTNEGGFWHKKIYPYQMWLDGLYMGEPFYAMYTKNFGDFSDFDDITNQFIYIYNHTIDKKTGLLFHGWDESKKQKWADQKTGQSPHFWGRAIGWYTMAIVDVLDFLPLDHPKRKQLITILQTVSKALLKYQDVKTGLWYQIIDLCDKKGNYLEASASNMFVYSFAKAARKGYLKPEFRAIAEKSFDGVLKYLTNEDESGNINLLHTCQGAGLGGNPYRDGSYEYYINEAQRTNDFKGYGPFMLSAIELAKDEKITRSGEGKVVGLDYYFNNEWKNGKQFHYVWEDTAFSGFSELGNVIRKQGAETSRISGVPTLEELKRLSAYIIVDPDTPLETAKPNYIDEISIKNIETWVRKGGVLVLLANDSNNCEFEHLNKLAGKFGIKFNGDSWNKVTGKNFDMGAFQNFPSHPLFSGVRKIYMKEISSIAITKPAKTLFKDKSINVIVESNLGRGYILAIGDPWLYNEYIDNRKLPEGFDNYIAAENLVKWILGKSKKLN
jgi:unsaturated rhamnogalacturonyl hydrolase